jgi:hypothetical protein
MAPTTSWFVQPETYEREVHLYEGEGDAKKVVATEKVTLRPLNAGDRAEIDDAIRIEFADATDDEEAKVSPQVRIGTMKRLVVSRALVSWTLELPVSEATLSQLQPDVFEQIFGHTSFGTPKAQESDPTPGSGPASSPNAAESSS